MKGFLLDLNRCTGCHACMLACSVENSLVFGQSWREVYTFNQRHYPGIARYHFSLGCLHCAEPACMINCPAGAYSLDRSTGVVLIDSGLCIGCRYCNWACPYGAPQYDSATGTMSKCTLCDERLSEGKDPACASLCPTGALQYVEMEAHAGVSEVPGFPATNAGPRIQFVPLQAAQGPASSQEAGGTESARGSKKLHQTPQSNSTVESEWSLIAFTTAAALLVAIAGAALAGALRIDGLDFLAAALGALGIGALHLGKKTRAWRSVINVRSSWLSREIVAYSAFLILGFGMFFLRPPSAVLSWAAVLSGFFALYCVDRVYGSIARLGYPYFHSAGAVLTGLFLCGVVAHIGLIAGFAGILKLVLYAERQPWTKSPERLLTSILRMSLGFVVPLALWRAYPDWVLPASVAAEVLDRCEYYLDLKILSPSSQIAIDLVRAASACHDQTSDLGPRTSGSASQATGLSDNS